MNPDEYHREIERRDELLAGADADLTHAREECVRAEIERDQLREENASLKLRLAELHERSFHLRVRVVALEAEKATHRWRALMGDADPLQCRVIRLEERAECAEGLEFCAENAETFTFTCVERGHSSGAEIAAEAFRAGARAIRARGGQ